MRELPVFSERAVADDMVFERGDFITNRTSISPLCPQHLQAVYHNNKFKNSPIVGKINIFEDYGGKFRAYMGGGG